MNMPAPMTPTRSVRIGRASFMNPTQAARPRRALVVLPFTVLCASSSASFQSNSSEELVEDEASDATLAASSAGLPVGRSVGGSESAARSWCFKADSERDGRGISSEGGVVLPAIIKDGDERDQEEGACGKALSGTTYKNKQYYGEPQNDM